MTTLNLTTEYAHIRNLIIMQGRLHVQILALAYLKVVSSLTSLHHLWRSLGPFNLPCAQKWP